MALSREKLEARAVALTVAFEEAARRDEWTWLVDEFYAPHCHYICEYAGTMFVEAKNAGEIRATHYGRDMRVGWEGWSFPIERYATRGNLIITHWWNRGPG
ncbi:MAG: nuclear transport factor 2 family protein, partial [Solimonas sp.]